MNIKVSSHYPDGGCLVEWLRKKGINLPLWLYAERFPIVPFIFYDKGDEHNSSKASFRWGPIWGWTIDNPELEIGLCCSTHWGLGLRFLFPYLRLVVSLPLPYSFYWVERLYSRSKFKL